MKVIVHNPATANGSFGYIPQITNRGEIIPDGEIYLLKGRHSGPNKGFGAVHIWAEHRKEMAARGFKNESDVASYVATIIRTGTPIYFSGENRKRIRITTVRSAIGTAVLEYSHSEKIAYWSVVTAYSANKKHGTLVGTVL
jgi:hypothetical protein